MKNLVYFNLRIEEETNEKIIEIAKKENRSKNSQIDYILKKYIEEYERKEVKNNDRKI